MTATSTPPSTSSPYAELKAPTTARRLLTAPTTGPLVALLLACVFFAVSTDQFLTGGNFSLIVQQVMVVGTLAIGQTLIILTAGIDLSCGAVMAFGSIVIAKMAAEGSLPPLLAIALGLAVCGGFGLLNGLLVQKIPLPPFIVTLGILNVAFALTHIYSEEQTVTNLPGPLTALGQTFPMGHTDITYGSLVTIGLFLLLAYALSSTGWGRHVYALGNSQEAARLNGIRTSRLTIGVYTVAGLLYTASPPCCSSPAPESATRRRARPTTSTASPPWSSAGPASSAAAARCSAPSSASSSSASSATGSS
ncbi:fructose transport system permease protein [Streptomyces sp. SAI-090]|nr:fructose transport system permease protein [Streptomyces sp. SAI-090]